MRQLYRMAADLGNAYGQLNFAADLDEEARSNEEAKAPTHALSLEATKYFRLAAEQGLANAQWTLSIRLNSGRGAPVDKRESLCWAARAAVRGHEAAIGHFQTLGVDTHDVEKYARITLPLQGP